MADVIRIPTSTHYSLSDLVLDIHTRALQSRFGKERKGSPPEIGELRAMQIAELKKANHDLQFTELLFSLRLASNLSSHEKEPFVQVWTSLSDKGVGKIDIAHRIRDIQEEETPEAFADRLDRDSFIGDVESKRLYMIDGTLQVPLSNFSRQEEAVVSECSHFTVYVPSHRASSSEEKPKYAFARNYPADASLHFQIHSNIGDANGNDAYALTGTGQMTFAQIATVVQDYVKAQEASGPQKEPNEDDVPIIEIPMILNSVSDQDPHCKLVDSVSKRDAALRHGSLDPASRDEALYKGSLFLYVRTQIPQTRKFFTEDLRFARPRDSDVTKGNFRSISDVLDMHVLRDMSPFIKSYTEQLAQVTVKEPNGKVVKQGWEFEPSLPEAHNIHAPYYKVNGHTLPGFKYYHDEAMKRLPSAAFIVNVGKIVLARHGMTMKAFIQTANNPVLKTIGDNDVHINPKYIKVLRIVGEIATSFSTCMNYRGDYADLNSDTVSMVEEHLQDPDRLHHIVHASGMTKRSRGKHPHRYYRWDEDLKIGTEAFGNALMDRSGDCEDFAKLIVQILAGARSSTSTHPMILSIQSTLRHYTAFAVLGSVFGRKVSDGEESASKRHRTLIGDIVVGSKEDLRAGIGAHMYALLLPERNVLRALQSTSSKVQRMPDGTELPSYVKEHISKEYLHKPLREVGKYESESVGARTRRRRSVRVHESPGPGLDGLNKDQLDAFYRRLPPLVLEGTGPANALVNAVESYYSTMEDKRDAINETLLEVEAVTRLISSMSSDQVTSRAIQTNQSVFKPFTMVISTNRLVDHLDVRISNFYRMLIEMYGIPDGHTDTSISPPSLGDLHRHYQKALHEEVARKNYTGTGPLYVTVGGWETASSAPVFYKQTEESSRDDDDDEEEEENMYGMERVFPVQLKARMLSDQTLREIGIENLKEAHEEMRIHESIAHVTYGVNLTDVSHQDENIGIMKTIKSLPYERKFIANVLTHTPPSPAFRLPPKQEKEEADRVAKRYDTILNKDIERTLSRGFFGHIQSRSLYVRFDNVKEEDISRLADYLANNPFARKAHAAAESFARGHHQLRITIDMDVSGTKQLYLESNTLAEHLTESEMRSTLRNQLEEVLSS